MDSGTHPYDRRVARPKTGWTKAHNMRFGPELWLPQVALAVAEGTTVTAMVAEDMRIRQRRGLRRPQWFASWPQAASWLEGNYPDWRRLADAIAAVTGDLTGPEYTAVAMWQAMTRHPGDPEEQKGLIAGFVLLAAAADTAGTWQEDYIDSRALLAAVLRVLDEHLTDPEPEADPPAGRARTGSPRSRTAAAAPPGTRSRTRAESNEVKVADCLRKHPGEKLRYEQIASACELTSQQASIALSRLLRSGTLPGLARTGRGTYQWDPPPAVRGRQERP